MDNTVTIIEDYMLSLAKLKLVDGESGNINVASLVDLHANHIPRLCEIIRLLYKSNTDVGQIEPNNDEEAELSNICIDAINKSKDVALDGLMELGYELEDEETSNS